MNISSMSTSKNLRGQLRCLESTKNLSAKNLGAEFALKVTMMPRTRSSIHAPARANLVWFTSTALRNGWDRTRRRSQKMTQSAPSCGQNSSVRSVHLHSQPLSKTIEDKFSSLLISPISKSAKKKTSSCLSHFLSPPILVETDKLFLSSPITSKLLLPSVETTLTIFASKIVRSVVNKHFWHSKKMVSTWKTFTVSLVPPLKFKIKLTSVDHLPTTSSLTSRSAAQWWLSLRLLFTR